MSPATEHDDHVSGLQHIRTLLAAGRAHIKSAHDQHSSAREIVAALTNLCDRAIEQTWQNTVMSIPSEHSGVNQQLALVAVGGYGRRDLAPYSDIDLLFLASHEPSHELREFISRLVRNLWDVGLKLSHSVRTVAGCITAARQDLTILTALAEARLLVGNSPAFTEIQQQICRLLRTTSLNRLITQIEADRRNEHHDYHAQTVLLLEPNLKKSPGGLRDYHVFRWLALARFGIREIETARSSGVLSANDADAIINGRDFLQMLRNEMHFHADSAQDVLTREEQLRLAAWLGYRDEGSLLGVERFMQHYYRHTTAIHEAVSRFTDRLRQPRLTGRILQRMWSEWVAEHFVLTRSEISIAPDARSAVLGDAELILKLFDAARDRGVPVAYESIERLRATCPQIHVTAAARRQLLRILAKPVGLGSLVRNLHRVGLLSRLLPPFEHARCLIQFNLLHRYTVDEHSLRALEAAVRRLEDNGPIGHAYRECRRKDLLHLAILLHDLGKGLGDDHCEIGRQLAEQVARDMQLDTHETQLLCTLVHQHLLMANTALRRDLSDDATLVQFARTVATPEMLRMLYVFTAADMQAVSPEYWTAWKEALLDELYCRTAEVLTGEAPADDEQGRARAIREELTRSLRQHFPADWLEQQLTLMSPAYLQTTDAATVADHLDVLRQMHSALQMSSAPVHVESRHRSDTNVTEYTVFTRDDLIEGLFSRIAGALAASGFQIVSARILTRPDGTVIDTFTGQDTTVAGAPSLDRRAEVAEQITAVLLGRRHMEDMLARRWQDIGSDSTLMPATPQVEIDNDSSERFTIIEVFAEDRLGRLYAITRTLFELGVYIHSARISTHGSQIVDVFYVTDRQSAKLADPAKSQMIRRELLQRLEEV